jgi:hypothetical protein
VTMVTQKILTLSVASSAAHSGCRGVCTTRGEVQP